MTGILMKPGSALFLISLCGLLSITTGTAGVATSSSPPRSLYAVNEAPNDRGSISVYDIDAGHHLIKTIQTVPSVGDVRGVAVSAVTGRLYVAYRDLSGTGMIYCLNIYDDTILWNRAVSPGVDRLAINPDGQLLYVPTWEGGSADYINVVDANRGDGTEIFEVRTHTSVGVIGSSEDLLEIDFANEKITQVGDQYGIGRR
jgi:DNA-binding beta-propeller fold protein YncE